MSTAFALFLLAGFSLTGLVFGTLKRVNIWRQGKATSEPINWMALTTIPKRYFVDLHHIVARDKEAARMHIFFAGGMILVLGLSFLSVIMPVGLLLKGLITIALVLVLVGCRLLLKRRKDQPSHLSYGRFQWTLSAAVGVTVGVLLILWTSFNLVGLLIACMGLFTLFWAGYFNAPLKHIISGSAHLAFHPRQQRFNHERATDLKILAEPTSLGSQTITDFSWQQILSFDACIECGRCEQACPAFASGQPLNPKKLIQDLYLQSIGANDSDYSGSHHPHKQARDEKVFVGDPLSQSIAPETLFACTTCRACVYECPMMIEHVDAIIDMRRHITMTQGDLPEKAVEALTNLRQTDTVGGFKNQRRHQWMDDLDIPFANADQSYDVLLLCGESAFDVRAQKTLRDLIALLRKANITVAALEGESDVGDVARRLGDEILFKRLATDMIARLKAVKFKKIVTLDPHIFHVISNEYPEFDGHFDIEHATTYLHQLIVTDNKIKTAPLNQSLTYHDPCYLGRYNEVIDAPRSLLKHIGIEVKEMHRSKMKSRCCGWGGGSAFTDISGDQRIPDMRMDDIRACDVNTVAVGCPNCKVMLEGVVEPRAEVVDVISLVAQSMHMNETQKEA